MKIYLLVQVIRFGEYRPINKFYSLEKARMRQRIYEKTYKNKRFSVLVFNKKAVF